MNETAIQRAIITLLQYLENQGKLYFFRSGAGAMKTANGSYFKTGKPGCPDISMCMCGRYIGLEVKTKKGRQTASQKEAQQRIEKAGGEYHIVRSVREVENIIANQTLPAGM